MKVDSLGMLAKALIWRVRNNEITERGAQLSYFLILSIFPFLLFLLTLLEYTPLTQEHTLQQISLILPQTAFAVVEQVAREVSRANHVTFLSLAFLGTVWSASRGTLALIRSINKAYDTSESRSFSRVNLIGIFFVFVLAVMIIFSLALLVFGKVIGQMAFEWLGLEFFFVSLWPYIRYFIPVLFLFSTFCFLYLYSPNVSVRYKTVFPGAVFSTLSWIAGSQAFAYYVNNFSNYSRVYGSIGGIIVFLVWLYISSVIILLGGEINAALHHSLTNRT